MLNTFLLWLKRRHSRFHSGSLPALLILLFAMAAKPASAQDNRVADPGYSSATVNSDGSVTFKILFYDDEDHDEFTTQGRIFVRVNGGSRQQILGYQSWDQSENKYYDAKVRSDIGVFEFTNHNGGIETKRQGEEGTVRFAREGEYLAYIKATWYYPQDWEGAQLTFVIDTTNDHANNIDWQPFGGSGTARSFPDPTLSDPVLSNEVGKYQLNYSTTTAPKRIYTNGKWANSGNTSGTLMTGIANNHYDYDFRVVYQYNKYYDSNEHRASKTVPAFQQPESLTATNIADGNTLLTWNTGSADANCQTGDFFEVQRADNADFTGAVDVGTLAFSPATTTYTLEDKCGALNLNGRYYYRVRRNKQPAWGWALMADASVEKSVSHQYVASACAERRNWDGDQEARISWTLQEKTIYKVWTEGSQIVVRRSINYGSGNIKTDDIIATAQDIENGYLIDPLNVTCADFTYKVFVRPGTTAFRDQEPVTAEIAPEYPILPTALGEITSITASKGYYPNYTTLEWTTDDQPIDNFEILRRPYRAGQDDESGWVTIATEPASSQTSYIFNDELGQPGLVYEYRVVATVKCVDQTVGNPSAIERGFRSPTGTISGQILFDYGDAVVGADVLVTSNQPELTPEQSAHFTGSDAAYLQTVTEPVPGTDVSLQLFAMPESEGQNASMLEWGAYRLALRDGKPAISADGGKSWLTASAQLPAGRFSQLTAVFDTDLSLYLYIDGEKAIEVGASGKVDAEASPARVIIGRGFTGYIDEVRLWTRPLSKGTADSKGDVENTFNRLLTGNESGLAGYWRLNDPVPDESYDISFTGTEYNKNHLMTEGDVTFSSEVYPGTGQLALRGLTDGAGNYRITGVPYVGNETSYQVTPSYPGHTFEPASTNVTIGGQQPIASGISFKDNSSVIIQGYVFYENSTIPITDVTFSIDGNKVIGSNGRVETTNERGQFKFSVPVGRHTVRVEKGNHTFVNDGLLLDSNGESYNFQDAGMFTDVRFWDSTRVKLIGRVAGGTVEQAKPVGFSLSTNNLGDGTYLKLTLEGNASADLTTVAADSIMAHYDGKHQNRVSYGKSDIRIYADSRTGEFEAWLYPEKYKIEEIHVTGYDNLLGGKSETLTLDNCFNPQTEEYVDDNDKSHIISYNSKYNYNHRVAPVVTYSQLTGSGGAELPYFGELTADITSATGESVTAQIYDEATGRYLFGRPVFRDKTYYFSVASHEDYYYNNVREGDDVRVDIVPTQGGTLKVTNEMSAETVSETELDDRGTAEVAINADAPDISGSLGGIKTLDFAVGETVAEQLASYVTGTRARGNSFVSAGPIHLLNILRDPPGSNSYSYMEAGQVYSYHTTRSVGKAHKGSEVVSAYLGATVITGVGVMTETDVDNTLGVKAEQEASSADANGETLTVTTTSRYQTSDDPLYVGADGDLFIGTTSNLNYGPADNIAIMTRDEYDRLLNAGGESGIYGEDHLLLAEAGDFVIAKRVALAVGVKYSTFFAYPQIYIKNTLLDNLRAVRNSLFLPMGTSESEAQAIANQRHEPVYITHRRADEEGYGDDNRINRNNNNEPVASGGYASSGDSYTVILPEGRFTCSSDSVYSLNQSIRQWEAILAQNEREKLQANDLVKNYSFHAGSNIEEAEQLSYITESSSTYNLIAGGGALAELGFKASGIGVVTTIEEMGYGTKDTEEGSSAETSRTAGFVLADDGDDDYLSVDVLRVKAPDESDFYDKFKDEQGKYLKGKQYGSFVFRTRGGATSCPYEGARVTEYYNPGTELDAATLQIEKPRISVERPVVSNVPSDQAAVFVLNLYNESEAAEGNYFNLSIVDAANQKGAKFSIDGVPLADKRGILVDYGEVLQKTLEIRRGTEYDYENLAVVLSSQCQADPTAFQEVIADTVYISVHFIPSASAISIKSPADKWTLNTNSPTDDNGRYYMPLTIDGFDVNFQDFHHIEVQYKASSEADSRWTVISSFYSDPDLYEAATGDKAMIDGSTIETRFYGAEDQTYDIRAVTYSLVGNRFVTRESAIVSGVKDTRRPVVFGNIEPADGVLGINDELRLTFNEPIAEGYMTEVKNFSITGVRNGSDGDHSTSVAFDGVSSYAQTQMSRNLQGKDVTVEMWINPSSLERDMTLLSHGGEAGPALELTLTKDRELRTRLGSSVCTSKPGTVAAGEWSHVAVTYSAETGSLSAYINGQSVLSDAPAGSYDGAGPITLGRGIDGGNNFAGKMHEARVWTRELPQSDIMANSLRIYTGREAGLLAYYPMNEGKGEQTADKSQGATAYMHGATWSTQEGKSLSFNGRDAIAAIDMSKVAISASNDYTLDFWFKASEADTEAALLSNGKGIGEENNGNATKVFVGFDGGKLVYRNNGYEQTMRGDYRDGAWHHFALTVNRTAGNAQIFMDGELNSYFDATLLGGFSSTKLYAGARRWTEAEQPVDHTDMHFSGLIDDIRIWNMALPSTMVAGTYNVSSEGSEMGLMMALPFSTYITNSANVKELAYSGADLVTGAELVSLENVQAGSDVPPVRRKAPESAIPFTFVVNNDAVVINLMDTPEAIEKTTLTFTVRDVCDLNGNSMESPVTWTAFIDRNQLRWSERSIALEKDLNEPLTFTVDIENQGGTVRNFTIEGVPSWLDATPERGSIDPQASRTITFVVDEGTNVGSFDEVLYVKGDNNVAEALPVTLKVRGQNPGWTVDPAQFKYNMNVFGRIRINNLFSTDAEDVLAVFDTAGRCIGAAPVQYLKAQDMWYTFLTVYCNQKHIDGNQLEFRTWDASTGTIYAAVPDRDIAFDSDRVIGSASAPVVFDARELVVRNIGLTTGWNWISFGVASELLGNPAAILAKADFTGGEVVKDETAGVYMEYDGTNRRWVTNNPAAPLKFDNRHMFLLQSSSDQTLSVSGGAVSGRDNLTLDIRPDWNYISYLPAVNLPVKEALAGYEASQDDIVKSQDRFAMYSEGAGWIGSLTYMEPGKGYMLHSRRNTTLTYPDIDAGGKPRARSRAIVGSDGRISSGKYQSNMSVVASVADNLPLAEGDRLLALSADGEFRGAADITALPGFGDSRLFFISVDGLRSEGISFALERDGEVIAQTEPVMPYVPHAVRGTVTEPMVIDFVNSLEISVYPNPFESDLNIDISAHRGDLIEITLHSVAGELIHRYHATAPADGSFSYHLGDLEGIPAGFYLATVKINGNKHVYKLIKR